MRGGGGWLEADCRTLSSFPLDSFSVLSVHTPTRPSPRVQVPHDAKAAPPGYPVEHKREHRVLWIGTSDIYMSVIGVPPHKHPTSGALVGPVRSRRWVAGRAVGARHAQSC